MNETFEVVKRPTGPALRAYRLGAFTLAVIGTATTGRAVRVPLNGRPQANIQAGLSHQLKARGLRSRTRRDGRFLFVWAEKLS